MNAKTLAAALALSVMSFGAANAAIVAGSDTCGELPNARWSWSISTSTVTTGGEVSSEYEEFIRQSGPNAFLVTITTTTTEPTFEATNTSCTALNPAGKVVLDFSFTIEGEPVETIPGSVDVERTNTKL